MSDIGRVYAQRRPDYVRVATGILGDHESACDAVNEAFVSAIRSRDRFRAEGSLEAWIWTIVVNVARDQWRKWGQDKRPSGPLESGGFGCRIGELDAAAEHAALHAQIAHLPERQRLILFLRFYADLDYAQIAHRLEISTGTVGATLHAALHALDPAHTA